MNRIVSSLICVLALSGGTASGSSILVRQSFDLTGPYGDVRVTVSVLDNDAGDFDRYTWTYLVRNVSFKVISPSGSVSYLDGLWFGLSMTLPGCFPSSDALCDFRFQNPPGWRFNGPGTDFDYSWIADRNVDIAIGESLEFRFSTARRIAVIDHGSAFGVDYSSIGPTGIADGRILRPGEPGVIVAIPETSGVAMLALSLGLGLLLQGKQFRRGRQHV